MLLLLAPRCLGKVDATTYLLLPSFWSSKHLESHKSSGGQAT